MRLTLEEIGQAELNRILDYNPETGKFRWKVNHKNAPKGSLAGCIARPKTKRLYRVIFIEGSQRRANKVAWLMMTGELPQFIRHIDGDLTNNAWDNMEISPCRPLYGKVGRDMEPPRNKFITPFSLIPL